MTSGTSRHDLAHDLVLPTLLFAALGGMTWAVRGCSGYGAVAGCIFAGVAWGTAWWYLAHEPSGEQTRRYASGWIVLAVTVGVGLSGARGWMQWPSFFEGKLLTNAGKGEFVPISRTYGFIWLFIAGVPWAGIGACMLAWCGSLRETRFWHWVVRIACGVGAAMLARYLYNAFPQYFLPLYESIEPRYQDFEANPNLRRLINDSGAAIYHLGFYLGFLLFEILRRDWKNAVLILTVGLVNGAGWALCQNWKWAADTWPDLNFNWWRCWESSGGISIGVAFGIAYWLVNRKMSQNEGAIVASRRAVAGPHFEWLLIYFGLTWLASIFLRSQMANWGHIYFTVLILFGAIYYFANRSSTPEDSEPQWTLLPANIEPGALVMTVALVGGQWFMTRELARYALLYLAGVMAFGMLWYLARRSTFEAEKARTTPLRGDPNLERLGLYLGLLLGLGLSIRNGLKGWFNIYKGDEDYWSGVLWQYLGPVFLLCLIGIVGWIVARPLPRSFRGPLFPHAYRLLWLVLVVLNILAQLVTGPLNRWNEMAFSIYYVLLLAITAVIVFHFHLLKTSRATVESADRT
jgi:hypothetical protein